MGVFRGCFVVLFLDGDEAVEPVCVGHGRVLLMLRLLRMRGGRGSLQPLRVRELGRRRQLQREQVCQRVQVLDGRSVLPRRLMVALIIAWLEEGRLEAQARGGLGLDGDREAGELGAQLLLMVNLLLLLP